METHSLYGGEVTLTFDPKKHRYTANGKPVDLSISGVLQVISKPALVPWAVKMACGHLERNLKPGVSLDEVEIKNLIDGARSAHRTRAQDAADIGTLVHSFIEDHLKGKNPSLPVNPQARNGAEQFLKFLDQHDFEVIESERKVYSRDLDVAGTCDVYGKLDGELVVADIKTSSGIYAEALLQTAGYDLLLNEELGLDFQKHIVINCPKDGDLNIHISDKVDRNREAFLSAVELTRNLNQLKEELK